jgi:hypothetical protein
MFQYEIIRQRQRELQQQAEEYRLVREAVVAARRSGDRERGLSLARTALRLVDEEREPQRAAWFRIQRARMLGHLHRPGGLEEIAYAHRLVAGLGPSVVQAETLALEASHQALRTPSAEAMANRRTRRRDRPPGRRGQRRAARQDDAGRAGP